jgi:hypothetical protein
VSGFESPGSQDCCHAQSMLGNCALATVHWLVYLFEPIHDALCVVRDWAVSDDAGA